VRAAKGVFNRRGPGRERGADGVRALPAIEVKIAHDLRAWVSDPRAKRESRVLNPRPEVAGYLAA